MFTVHSHEKLPTFGKADTNKPMVSLVEPNFTLGIAEVLTIGAQKYSIDNWKSATADDQCRFIDALLRHILAYNSGEKLDPETNKSHLLHAACNLMFLHHFEETK